LGTMLARYRQDALDTMLGRYGGGGEHFFGAPKSISSFSSV
jgi:hypothetical protein